MRVAVHGRGAPACVGAPARLLRCPPQPQLHSSGQACSHRAVSRCCAAAADDGQVRERMRVWCAFGRAVCVCGARESGGALQGSDE